MIELRYTRTSMPPALIKLTQAHNFSAAEVGELSHQLANLAQAGIPVPPTAIIPRSTLELIVLSSNLVDVLKKTLQHTTINKAQLNAAERKIKQELTRVRLPEKIINPILSWYDQHPGFIKVKSTDRDSRQTAHQNVHGDANLIDSILSVWAEGMSLDLKRAQLQIFAEPIIIQLQPQSEISGIALTRSTNSKTQLQILSTWGVYTPTHPEIQADELIADVRTEQIIQRRTNPQYLQLQRVPDGLKEITVRHYKQDQLSLDQTQAQRLLEVILKSRKVLNGRHQLNWCYHQDQFLITDVSDLKPNRAESGFLQSSQIILRGDSLQPGIISGQILHINAQTQARNIESGKILVAHDFHASQLPLVKKATALICEQGVSNPDIFQYLKAHTLPTLVNARHALSYLQNGQEVILNASAGQVLKPNQAHQKLRPAGKLTATKVFIAAGNPRKTDEYLSPAVDGVGVLRAEYTLASFGEHPLHLVSSRRKSQLQAALVKTIQAYQQPQLKFPVIYRAQNFTSQELQALKHATAFEPNEPNPYLGLRGGLKILSNFSLFEVELAALAEVLAKKRTQLGLMLPFIRTPSELQLITQYVHDRSPLKPQPHFGLYLQLNTPENILQLRRYLHTPLAGVSINARSVHALLHGIDPDSADIYHLYTYDLELMGRLLKEATQVIRSKPDNSATHRSPAVFLHVEDYNLQLVEIAAELGLDAVIVKPSFAKRAKERIQEIEAHKFHV